MCLWVKISNFALDIALNLYFILPYGIAKEKFASIRNKIMIRRTKQLIADQLPQKGQLFYHVCLINDGGTIQNMIKRVLNKHFSFTFKKFTLYKYKLKLTILFT